MSPLQGFTSSTGVTRRVAPGFHMTPLRGFPHCSLACAVAAGCEVIVSGDSHLLRLKQYEQLRILTAAELLAEIKPS